MYSCQSYTAALLYSFQSNTVALLYSFQSYTASLLFSFQSYTTFLLYSFQSYTETLLYYLQSYTAACCIISRAIRRLVVFFPKLYSVHVLFLSRAIRRSCCIQSTKQTTNTCSRLTHKFILKTCCLCEEYILLFIYFRSRKTLVSTVAGCASITLQTAYLFITKEPQTNKKKPFSDRHLYLILYVLRIIKVVHFSC